MRPSSTLLDAYYTPPALAKAVADAMPSDLSGSVLDPTVGGGALLAAVESRFGHRVDVIGIDIDPTTIKGLRRAQPSWKLSTADVLDQRSRRGANAWRAARVHLDAAVLNPPFSHRGNGGERVTYGDFAGRVGPAMQFLIAVLAELRPIRCVVAVLPDGAIDADRHQTAWIEIERRYNVERLERFSTSSFKGARVATSLVRLTPRDCQITVEAPALLQVISPVDGCGCVEVVRGRVQVHSLKGRAMDDPAPFLHTTGIKSRKLPEAPGWLADFAPLVAIVRVGRWAEPRTIEVGRVVLSDCLIGLRPRDRSQLDRLAASVAVAAPAFIAAYRGTGAQYITMDNVSELLLRAGWHPHRVRAGADPEECCCVRSERHGCSSA